MSRPIVVLRPEPGAAATLARIAAAGAKGIAIPLFAPAEAIGWAVPAPGRFDALLLTSAQTPRLAGPGLHRLAALPVCAVGDATAQAARAAGLMVRMTGSDGVAALSDAMARAGIARALWLTGEDRTGLPAGAPVAATVAVYRVPALAVSGDRVAQLADSVVLLHSTRAARRLAALVGGEARPRVALVAISDAVAGAAGPGWADIATAERPDDGALVAAAIDRARRDADKRRR